MYVLYLLLRRVIKYSFKSTVFSDAILYRYRFLES